MSSNDENMSEREPKPEITTIESSILSGFRFCHSIFFHKFDVLFDVFVDFENNQNIDSNMVSFIGHYMEFCFHLFDVLLHLHSIGFDHKRS
jgi:hypothetical protein